MKRVIFSTIALALMATTAAAHEIDAGRVMFMGDTSLDYSSSEVSASGSETTTDKVELNFTSLYFVRPNLGVGLLLGYEDSETDDGTTVEKQSMTMFGPVVGYNISLDHNTSLMLNAGIFTASGDMDDGAGNTGDIDGEGYILGAAFAFFLNDNVAVNLGVRQIDADIDLDDGATTTSADMTETAFNVGFATFF